MSDLIPQHVAWLRAGKRSKHTYVNRERVLWRANEALVAGGVLEGLDDAHTDEIGAYLDRPDWSAWTVHAYWRHLNSFYVWGFERGDFEMNPMDALIRPNEGDRLPDPCTDDELTLALASFPGDMQPMGLAIRLAGYAGLRCCEIVDVRREDCNPQRLRVTGKGGLKRSVDMSPQLWEYIRDLPPGPVCRGRGSRQAITAGTLSTLQSEYWRAIGLPEMHLHRLRHWFATSLIARGVPLPVVQVLMGHRSISSTVQYTLVVSEQRAAAVRLLPSLGGHGPVSSWPVPGATAAA